MDGLRGPLDDLSSRAVSMLVEGLCKEILHDIQYSGVETVDAIPGARSIAIRDQLEAAKWRFVAEIDNVMARLASNFNQSSAVHRLPVEITVMVLKEFKPTRRGGSTHLCDLLLVCKSWYETIMQSPQLWGHLEAPVPRAVAQLLLARSEPYPIVVNWNLFHLLNPPPRAELEPLMKLVVANSNRISSLGVSVTSSSMSQIRPLLEAPTALLKNLQVYITGSGSAMGVGGALYQFNLSEGSPIKHLDLNNISTSLNSSRLFNLLSLELSNSAIPSSPNVLLQALSGMQALKRLNIHTAHPSIAVRVNGDEPQRVAMLPRLKTLVLFDISSFYTSTILTCIGTPICDDVVVVDKTMESLNSDTALDDALWDSRNGETAVLLGAITSKSHCTGLRIVVRLQTVSITPSQPTQNRLRLTFVRRSTSRFMIRMANAASKQSSFPPIKLRLLSGCFSDAYPLDLTPWGEKLESLIVLGADQCREVVRQLSRRQVVETRGHSEWACQKLSDIRLVYAAEDEENVALDGEALLELARQRWSTAGGSTMATPPSLFRVRCLAASFPHMWRVEKEVRKILPGFELIEELFEVE